MSQPNAILNIGNLLRIKSLGLIQAVSYLFNFFYIDSCYATLKMEHVQILTDSQYI
jgi:hypothetical protein